MGKKKKKKKQSQKRGSKKNEEEVLKITKPPTVTKCIDDKSTDATESKIASNNPATEGTTIDGTSTPISVISSSFSPMPAQDKLTHRRGHADKTAAAAVAAPIISEARAASAVSMAAVNIESTVQRLNLQHEKEIEALQQQLKLKDQEIMEQKKMVREEKHLVLSKNNKIELLEARIKGLKIRVEAKEQTEKTYHANNEEKDISIVQLTRALEKKEQELNKIMLRVQNAQLENEQMKEEITKKDAKHESDNSAKDNIASAKARKENAMLLQLTREVKEGRQRNEQYKKEANLLIQETTKKQKEIDDMKIKIGELESDMEDALNAAAVEGAHDRDEGKEISLLLQQLEEKEAEMHSMSVIITETKEESSQLKKSEQKKLKLKKCKRDAPVQTDPFSTVKIAKWSEEKVKLATLLRTVAEKKYEQLQDQTKQQLTAATEQNELLKRRFEDVQELALLLPKLVSQAEKSSDEIRIRMERMEELERQQYSSIIRQCMNYQANNE